jgi:hypothetical protein
LRNDEGKTRYSNSFNFALVGKTCPGLIFLFSL